MIIVSRIIHVKLGWQLNVTNNVSLDTLYLCFCFQCFVGHSVSMFLFLMFRGTPCIYVFVFNVWWYTLYLCFCFQCFVGHPVSIFLFLMFRGTPCIYVFVFKVLWDTLYLFFCFQKLFIFFCGSSEKLRINGKNNKNKL